MGDQLERPEVRWGLGCLLSGVSFTGLLILVILVAILAQPPPWLQTVMGLAIVAGAAIFTWVLASALGRGRKTERALSDKPDIEAVRSPEDSPDLR